MTDLHFPKPTPALLDRRHACIEGHVKAAKRAGANGEEVREAIWVATEMRAGAAWAHALRAVDLLHDDGSGAP